MVPTDETPRHGTGASAGTETVTGRPGAEDADSGLGSEPGPPAGAGPGHSARRWRRWVPTRPAALTTAAGAVLTAILLVIHGQLPWLVSSEVRWFMARGLIECGSLSIGDLVNARCPLIGADGGGDIANGVLFIGVGAAFRRALGISPDAAFVVTAVLFMAAAVWGTYGLARRLDLDRVFSLAATFIYLASPTILGLHGFGSTVWGVALVPAAVHVSMFAASGIVAPGWHRRALWLAAWSGTSLAMLLLDGYGFVMSQSTAALLLLWPVVRRPRAGRGWVSLAGFGVANTVAFATYRQIVHGAGDWAPSSIDLFRAMGADLTTLVIPSPVNWWAAASPWQVDPAVLWGDGSNSRFNYLGLGILVLTVVGVIGHRKRSALVVPILLLALIALVMSLGPSLKIDEVRGPLVVPVTYESYLMPAEDAVIELPTRWVYEEVPGFTLMRGTYRWLGVARLAFALLAAAGLQVLWRRRRGVVGGAAVAALAVVAVAEVSPNYEARLASYAQNARMADSFDREVLAEMQEAIPEGTRLVYAPNAVSENDFLANYLSPMLGATSYNIGGDKALEAAIARWPEDVRALVFSEAPFAEAARETLESGRIDMVVVPFFDLRWSATGWPTSEAFSAPGVEAAASAAEDDALTVRTYSHFAVITLSAGSTGE